MCLKKNVSFFLVVVMILFATSVFGQPTNSITIPIKPLYEPPIMEEGVPAEAEMYAKKFNISVDEALHRFETQDAAGILQEKLMIEKEETFAGLWIEHTPEFKVIVALTSGNKDEINSYLKNDLLSIVEVQTAKLSYAELSSAQMKYHDLVESLGVPTESYINVQENSIELNIVDQETLDNSISNGKLKLPEYFHVNKVSSLGRRMALYPGGHEHDDGTLGFSVISSTGIKGVITAGHCKDNIWLLDGVGAPLQYMSGVVGGSRDVQWHTYPTYLTPTNEIYIGSTTRTITSVKPRLQQPVGGLMAKYGATTGYTLGFITSISERNQNVPNSTNTWVRVDNTYDPNQIMIWSGDSGGPWFLGNTAYGISSLGHITEQYAIYMPLDYIEAMGIYVMTAP